MTVFAIILTLATVFVNGWTDAPNAIASAVGAGVLSIKRAIILASVFNLLGTMSSALLGNRVVHNIYMLADCGKGAEQTVKTLCAALAAVIIWSVAAWFFGLPTSESHGLVAGLCGAAFKAGSGNISAAILPVIIGLVISTFPAALLGYAFYRIFLRINPSKSFCRSLQTFSAALSAFAHGAQDGQKFIALLFSLMLVCGIGKGGFSAASLVCAAIMTLGTAAGGGRIVRKVGFEMAELDAISGSAADIASFVCLIACTVTGLPVSTTHTKTCAIAGACRRKLNLKPLTQIIIAWLLTFPACFAISYALSALILN